MNKLKQSNKSLETKQNINIIQQSENASNVKELYLEEIYK